MPDPTQNIIVRILANNATAQLRSLIDVADRDEARRLSAELKRMATQLDRKHNFPGRGKVKACLAVVE